MESEKIYKPSIIIRFFYGVMVAFIYFLIFVVGTTIIEEFSSIIIYSNFFTIGIFLSPFIGLVFAVLNPSTIKINDNNIKISSLIRNKSYILKDYSISHLYGFGIINSRFLVLNRLSDDKEIIVKLSCISKKTFNNMMNYINKMQNENEKKELIKDYIFDLDDIEKKSIRLNIIIIIFSIIGLIIGFINRDITILIASIFILIGILMYTYMGLKIPNNRIIKAVINKNGFSFTTKIKVYNYKWEDINKIKVSPMDLSNYNERQIIIINEKTSQEIEFSFGEENQKELDLAYEKILESFKYYKNDKLNYLYN